MEMEMRCKEEIIVNVKNMEKKLKGRENVERIEEGKGIMRNMEKESNERREELGLMLKRDKKEIEKRKGIDIEDNEGRRERSVEWSEWGNEKVEEKMVEKKIELEKERKERLIGIKSKIL